MHVGMIEPYLGQHPEIHPDAFIHPAATVIGRVKIGARSTVWPGAVLRGDDGWIEIGEETSIQDGTVVHMTEGQSNTFVGSGVTVGHGVILHGCHVGDGALVGMGAIVLDNARVEAGGFVAAGTLIPPGKVVPSGKMAMGNPFKIVRDLKPGDLEWQAFGRRTYVKRCAEYKAREQG